MPPQSEFPLSPRPNRDANRPRADWELPRGVTRSLWEFANSRQIAEEEEAHLAGSPLLELDRQYVERWLPPSCRAVDLGCGTGRLLLPLARRGCQVVGVDLSEESLRRAAGEGQSLPTPPQFLLANLCELDCLAPGTFDAALLMFATLGMVRGAEQRREVLQHARRLLVSGGTLLVHVHSIWSQRIAPAGRRWLAGELWRRIVHSSRCGETISDYRGIPEMYHHLFTRRELVRLLQAAAFQVEEVVPIVINREGEIIPARFFVNVRSTGWIVRARAE